MWYSQRELFEEGNGMNTRQIIEELNSGRPLQVGGVHLAMRSGRPGLVVHTDEWIGASLHNDRSRVAEAVIGFHDQGRRRRAILGLLSALVLIASLWFIVFFTGVTEIPMWMTTLVTLLLAIVLLVVSASSLLDPREAWRALALDLGVVAFHTNYLHQRPADDLLSCCQSLSPAAGDRLWSIFLSRLQDEDLGHVPLPTLARAIQYDICQGGRRGLCGDEEAAVLEAAERFDLDILRLLVRRLDDRDRRAQEKHLPRHLRRQG